MAYWAIHLPIATRFEDLFPANHPNTLLYRQFRRQYGGAQTLVLMIRVKNGDIFNLKTLQDIQDITGEVDKLYGVNHNESILARLVSPALRQGITGRTGFDAFHVSQGAAESGRNR